MSTTNKKFRIQNGVAITGEVAVNNQIVITEEGKILVPAISDAVATIVAADIALLQSQVDTILGTSPESLNTLQEIVAFFNAEDGDIQTLITGNTTAITGNTTAITGNATAITALQTMLLAIQTQVSGIGTSTSDSIEFQDDVDMKGNKITDLGTPSLDTDAATKSYVDTLTSAVDFSSDIATAKSEAISTASADATTKAAAAQASASADATSKADAAETDAKAYADQVVAATVDASPAALNTLNELAAALGDDANFSATVTASIATKANQTALDAETSARSAADTVLQSNIDGEETARLAGDASLQSAIATITSTQSGDQINLQTQVTAEVARALSAEAVNAANISSEIAARTVADTALESDIIGLQNQVGTIIGGSPTSLDTLVELVGAFESADSDLSGVLTANGVRLTTVEATAAANAAYIADENSATGYKFQTGQTMAGMGNYFSGQVLANATRLDTAEATITIHDDYIALENSEFGYKAQTGQQLAGMGNYFSNEISSLHNKDVDLQNNIDAQGVWVSAALAQGTSDGVSAQAAITAEETRALGIEGGLQTQISNILSNTDETALNSLAEIVTSFQSADGTLTGAVAGHGSRLTTAEADISYLQNGTSDDITEGPMNQYWTAARSKSVLSGGLCIDFNSTTGEIKIDEVETASSLHVATSSLSTDANGLGGQAPSHYRIDVYDVNGSVVN